jgi:hypothetical protein
MPGLTLLLGLALLPAVLPAQSVAESPIPSDGRRYGVRDRVGDQGLHVVAADGHGPEGRGVARRSYRQVPAARGEMPERGGKKITLRDLSTQYSGLPRMPNNFAPKDAANPYADYSVEQMCQFLSGYELKRDIGAEFEYSNLAVGVLRHALSRRAGMSYEALAKARGQVRSSG